MNGWSSKETSKMPELLESPEKPKRYQNYQELGLLDTVMCTGSYDLNCFWTHNVHGWSSKETSEIPELLGAWTSGHNEFHHHAVLMSGNVLGTRALNFQVRKLNSLST